MAKLAAVIPFVVMAGFWFLVSLIYGEQLVPAPSSVIFEGARLLGEIKHWEEISITLFRGVAVVTVLFVIGFILAVPFGCGITGVSANNLDISVNGVGRNEFCCAFDRCYNYTGSGYFFQHSTGCSVS